MMLHQVRRMQRGAGALAVSMLLLFGSSIVVFYLNRGLIFEQKTSANQLRSTIAFEMADAGIEWATGMLNQPNDVDPATCGFLSTANISFRRKYVQTNFTTSSDVNATTTTFPGCKVINGAPNCRCPDVPVSGTATAGVVSTLAPGFTVAFANVTGDPEAVSVTSTGCTAQSGACTPGTAGNSDATATVSVILKLRPLLRAAPAAALTCGTSCAPGGSGSVVNTDPATNGITIDSGTTATLNGSASVTTIDGIPSANSIISNDTALSALSSADTSTCSNSDMFSAYFGGLTLAQYQASTSTKTINCTQANDCGPQLVAAYNDGWRAFYMPAAGGLTLNNSSGLPNTTVNGVTSPTLGGPTDGVTLVTPGSTNINGNIRIYGLIFANDANANDIGFGTADIYGSVITCRGYSSTGHGTINYLGSVMTSTRRATALLVRVPGSWKDY
jgi:Tfp pilus assembly protein PilX